MVNGIAYIPLPGQSADAGGGRKNGRKPAFVLRRFLVGPENRLVEVAVRNVLARPANGQNPLVIYGPSGTGKSHIAHGLAVEWAAESKSHPDKGRVVYTTAIDFARKLADAVETQATDDFRAWYQRAGLLVIEDLGELVGKQAAQEELIHALDALVSLRRHVVVTSPRSPAEMSGLMPMLQSRLTAGLSVPLCPPGVDARRAILREMAETGGVGITEPVARILADGLRATVPELRGALAELEMTTRLRGGKIDAETAKAYLDDRNSAAVPEIREIALASAKHFSLKLGELRSSSRRRPVVTARNVAMYLARQLTGQSLEKIGEYFGGRDHTTVMHGCRKMEKQVETDPAIRQAVEKLQTKWRVA